MPKKTLPSLRNGARPGFLTNLDIYRDPSSWSVDDAYACFRYITHLVGRASTRERYAKELRGVRFSELHNSILAMFKVALAEATAAQNCLTVRQMRCINSARPCTPPLVLSNTPRNYPRYEKMGIIL